MQARSDHLHVAIRPIKNEARWKNESLEVNVILLSCNLTRKIERKNYDDEELCKI